MKKSLSILLVIMMILSTVSFAAPSVVSTADSTAELTQQEETEVASEEETANLSAEDLGEEVLLREYNFDTDLEGWRVNDGYVGGLDGNGAIYAKGDGTGKTDPQISVAGLPYRTEYITKIEVRVKKETTSNQTLQLFYMCNGDGAKAGNMAQVVYSGTDWVVATFNTSDFTGTWEGKFTSIRLDPGNIAQTKYWVDYVKIYGYVAPINFTPGINILTRTEEPLTFDELENTKATEGSLKDANGKTVVKYALTTKSLSVVDTPVAGDTGKALMFSDYDYATRGQKKYKTGTEELDRVELYPDLRFTTHDAPEDGRPVLIKFDSFIQKANDESETVLTYGTPNTTYILYNGNGNGSARIGVLSKDAAPAWTSAYNIDAKSGSKGLATLQFCAPVTVAGFEKYTEDGKDIMNHYVDNVGYYPYYKVTYMNGEEVVGTAWVLDNNGVLLDSFDPTAQGVALPEGKNGWATSPKGIKTTSVALENKDIVLYAVNTLNFRPGINILTGTEELQDFENLGEFTYDDSKNILYDENGKSIVMSDSIEITIDETPIAGETGYALKMYGYNDTPNTNGAVQTTYPKLNFHSVGYKKPEDGRPVFITFDATIINTDYAGSAAKTFWVLKGNASSYHSFKESAFPLYKKGQTPAWKKYGIKDSVAGGSELSYIQFSFAPTAVGAFEAPGFEPNHYVDNIGYYPYYKVTYMNGDTEVGSAWVLDDGNGNILEAFDPMDQGVELPYGMNAWSLTKNGEEATSIELDNDDIVVYATYVDRIPESTDELLMSLEFNGTTEDEKASDLSALSFHDSKTVEVKNGNLIITAKETETKKHDVQLQITDSNRFNIPAADISRIEVRYKLENITEYDGKEVTSIGGDRANFFYIFDQDFDGHGTGFWGTRQGNSDYYSRLTTDEEGYYNITFETASLPLWADAVAAEANLIRFRFDHSNSNADMSVDYIRIYGKNSEFTPMVIAPQKREGLALRVDNEETTGVRFRAAMANETRAREDLVEYGWIVALADTLGVDNELTHQFKAADGRASYVTGKSYCKINGNNIDKIYTTEESYTIFTAVITGVPVQYADRYLVVRPYSVVGGAYVYGESITTCPRDVGQEIYNKWVEAGSPEGDTAYDYIKYKDYIDTLGIKK